MRVPHQLAHEFEIPFQTDIAEFLTEQGLLERPEDLASDRFLSRSVLPHFQRLSDRFNRIDASLSPDDGLYWKDTSNRDNLRLAYFLAFGPCNQMRMAAIWAELARLGWRWRGNRFRAIEWGAGPAAAATGIARGEQICSTGLPAQGTWALLDRDRSVVELGARWAERCFKNTGHPDWQVQTFPRALTLEQTWLPRTAPRFDLWVESFFLNELWGADGKNLDALITRLVENWKTHLNDEGLVILMEPALRAQSRLLLEFRKRSIPHLEKMGMQVLLPCLGHQACGALAKPDDWCHEEIAWWRAPYLKRIDELTGRDHKSLDFSYLVLAKSKRSREELLPGLAGKAPHVRIVSPSHKAGRDRDIFICGQDGKRRARWQTPLFPERGDILGSVQVRGAPEASRLEQAEPVAWLEEATSEPQTPEE